MDFFEDKNYPQRLLEITFYLDAWLYISMNYLLERKHYELAMGQHHISHMFLNSYKPRAILHNLPSDDSKAFVMFLSFCSLALQIHQPSSARRFCDA